MENNIEKRLHRVMIKLDRRDVKCLYSKYCDSAENCTRCDQFYEKCSKYNDFSQDFLKKNDTGN